MYTTLHGDSYITNSSQTVTHLYSTTHTLLVVITLTKATVSCRNVWCDKISMASEYDQTYPRMVDTYIQLTVLKWAALKLYSIPICRHFVSYCLLH